MTGRPLRARSLARALGEGIEAQDRRDAARAELSLGDEASDFDLARGICRMLAASRTAELVASRDWPGGDAADTTVDASSPASRLSVPPRATPDPGLVEVDVHTLLLLARGAPLRGRRDAVRALAERANGQGFGGARADVETLLTTVDDAATAYESGQLRRAGVDPERHAKRADERFRALVERVSSAIDGFWDAVGNPEPIDALVVDERALLAERLRDAPDKIAAHVASQVEDEDGDTELRARLVHDLAYAADRRVVPALIRALHGPTEALHAPAAVALGHTDDARALPALRAAFARSHTERERVAVAGALGHLGDFCGRDDVRRALRSDADAAVLDAVVDALASAGTPEDALRLLDMVDEWPPSRRERAFVTIGAIGDADALPGLHEQLRTAESSGIRGRIEAARLAIAARVEICGEPRPDLPTVDPRRSERPVSDAAPTRRATLRAIFSLWVGRWLLAIGAARRAIGSLERAGERRPDWFLPKAELGVAYTRTGQNADAIAAFRAALRLDRRRIEHRRHYIQAVARVFLRRADALARGGQGEIGQALAAEVLAFDLRRASSSIVAALRRRRDGGGEA